LGGKAADKTMCAMQYQVAGQVRLFACFHGSESGGMHADKLA